MRRFAILVLSACATRPLGAATPRTDSQTTQRFLAPDVDVMLVVDSSGSMTDARRGLAAAIPAFGRALASSGLDFRVGVVTTDLGAAGRSVESCLSPDGGTAKGWVAGDGFAGGDVGAELASLADVGTEGCAFEMPLESARRALAASPPRPDAAVAVVVLTDEDDCSVADGALFDVEGEPMTSFRCFAHPDLLTDPGALAHALTELRPDGRAALVVAAGPPSPVTVGEDLAGDPMVMPSCSSDLAIARPGVRLAQAVSAMGASGKLASLCDGSLDAAVDAIRGIAPVPTKCLAAAPGGACSVEADGQVVPAQIVPADDCASGWAVDQLGAVVDVTCPN